MSSKIYELFGYLTNDHGVEAELHRKECLCPFTGVECDGGGNRYQSFLNPRDCDREVIAYLNNRTNKIPAGVCSLETAGQVWIVCPRRLFVLDRGEHLTSHEEFCKGLLRRYAPFSLPCDAGVWSEAKIKYTENSNEDDSKVFDYTFDYIICPISPKPLPNIATLVNISESRLERDLLNNGYTIKSQGGIKYVQQYPSGNPLVIEVMTSSTAGGNKEKGTTIQNAFVRALMSQPHEGPGINYRQVWARMVSQLIVKSQIGNAWGGRTIWVLQNALVRYISSTTDLNLRKLISEALKEVNILSLRYSDTRNAGTHPLEVENLYAGPIPKIQDDSDFNKLLQAASIPPKDRLEKTLITKKLRTVISL